MSGCDRVDNRAMRICLTQTAEETRALAARLAARLRPGDILLLEGALGAGKTTFVQGLAEGLGVRAPVTSPTFTLLQEYPGAQGPLLHFDLYRLDRPEEVVDLGFEESLERGGVVVVEWAERLGWLTPPEHLRICMEREEGERRRIALLPSGSRYRAVVAGLEEAVC